PAPGPPSGHAADGYGRATRGAGRLERAAPGHGRPHALSGLQPGRQALEATVVNGGQVHPLGVATAAAPGARLVTVEGMRHTLPRAPDEHLAAEILHHTS
ncbi:hypothetical protein ABZ281_23540, partial [Streptomyces sp. NPDC006265]